MLVQLPSAPPPRGDGRDVASLRQDTALRQKETLRERSEERSSPRSRGNGGSFLTGSLSHVTNVATGDPVGSIVRLQLDLSDGSHRWGTGFVIAEWPACVVTCGHLFHQTSEVKRIVLASPEKGSGRLQAISWAATRAGAANDMAVLWCMHEILDDAGEGLRAGVVENDFAGTLQGYRAGQTSLTTLRVRASPSFSAIHYAASTSEGMSGSPLFDDHGLVVGIHRGTDGLGNNARAEPVQVDLWRECMLVAREA